MKLLVIGGTRFVGRHLVEAALARGHTLTLFNRGLSSAPPANVEALVGDRRGDLSALRGRRFDAVLDCCGYLPAEVAAMAAALHGNVGVYGFVSSVAAYASAALPNDEHSPLGTIDDAETTLVDGRTYGPLKALCEAAAVQRFGEAVLLLRPGLVVGPHDPTQRFTYWPGRAALAADGAPALAPGTPEAPVQFIDARDLAAFALHLLEAGTRGCFNVVGAAGELTMGDLLDACAAAAGTRPRWVWAAMAALQAQGLAPWNDLPLALPDDGDLRAFMQANTGRAVAAGLVTRPLAVTVGDTLAWWRALPADAQRFDKAGLSREREAAVLAALALPL